MRAIVELSVRRPRLVLALWIALVAGLGLAGLRVEDQLRLTDPVVPGSGSAQAREVVAEEFGDQSALVVQLDGSPPRLRESGPRIARALARVPHVAVVSPWLGGASPELRPSSSTAIVPLGVRRPFESVAEDTVPALRAALERAAPAGIEYHLTGYADIAGGIEQQTFAALRTTELIAAPLLFLILLLVFRGPVAAAVPLCLGLSSLVAGRGILAALNATVLPLDAAALSLASMFGLALGVDYSLLLVSRFREQLAGGDAPETAAREAAAKAGRTVLVAGAALAIGMGAGYLIAPNQLLASGNLGGLIAVLISIAGAILAAPAMLTVLGERVNSYRLFAAPERSGLAGLAWRAVSRPLLASALVLVVLLLLCLPAVGLKVAPPSDGSLARGSAQLADLRAIGMRSGSGWITPYEVVVRSRRRLATDPRILSAMAAWEARLQRDPTVAAAMGPRWVYGGEGPPSRGVPFRTQARINLALLRGAPPAERSAATLALNLDRGGHALRMTVVRRSGMSAALADDAAAIPGDPLRAELTRQAGKLAARTGTEISIGGPAADLQDFAATSQSRLLPLVAVLALCTFLVLLLALRAPVVGLFAVALNLLTVGAALGTLVLCFQRAGLLASAGPLDAIVVPAVISIAFGLAIDYEVFLLSRVREEMAAAGDAERGLRRALERTAGVITGAAAIMCAVFLAFATASIVNLREYGVGLAVAVLIDATIVRLVLLPAGIRMLGPAAWWIPAWLDRLLDRAGQKERRQKMKDDDTIGVAPAHRLLGCLLVGLALAGSLWGATRPATAGAAVRSLDETMHLRIEKASGKRLSAAGTASGTVAGRGSFDLILSNGSRAAVTFSGHNRHGTISGTGVATYRVSGAISSFSGRVTSLDGSGRYAHAESLGIGFSGTVNRRTHVVKMRLRGKWRA
jgi:putative drug exporter of the RND superfamily